MIVYGSTLSPFVRKVLVYGTERGLDMTQKPTAFGKPDPEFEATSPFRKIPGFRDGDFVMSDSTAIIAYLEAKYCEGRLTPATAEQVGRVTWFEEFADTVAFLVQVHPHDHRRADAAARSFAQHGDQCARPGSVHRVLVLLPAARADL